MQTKHKSNRIPLVYNGLLLGCLLTCGGSIRADPPVTASPTIFSDQASALLPQASPPPASSQKPAPSVFEQGMEAYKKGDMEGARKLLAEAATAEPDNGDCQAILGYLLAQAGQYDDALLHLEKAVTMRTISISATNSRLNLGKALLMRPGHTDADTHRAVGLFEDAAALSPHAEDVQMTLGYGYTKAGSYDKAAAAYRRATEITPAAAAAWKSLGLTLRKTGPIGEAIAALKKSAELNAADVVTWANLGDAYLDRAETPAALAAFEAGHTAVPDNVPLLIRIGNLDLRLLHFSEAGDAYGAAADRLEADPAAATGITAASLRFDQGGALSHTARLNDAETAYEKALALQPKYADALLNSGSLLFKQGKVDAAIGRFKRVTEIQPDSELGWANLAVAADRNHDTAVAIAAWRRAVALRPANYDSHDRFADSLLQQNPTSDEAAKQYIAMQHLRPHASDASISLGLLYQRQSEAASLASIKQAKLTLAMNAFLEAIRREPRSAIAYNDLGVVHERRGEIPEAITAYTKAVTLDPRLADARKNLARFHAAPAGRPR